jgi:tetratricopeptide (TPR) repeat protein
LRRNPHAALALAAAAAEPLRWTRQTRDLVEASLAAAPDAPADLRARARFLLMMDDWTTAGDTPDAIPELRELIAAMAAGHDDRNVAAARILLASFLHRLGQREEAHEELERARLLAGELDDRYLLATEVWERGWQFLSRGDYPSAETLLEDAAARFDDIGNRLHAARVNLGLGFAKGAQGDWEAQAELARTALATFDAFGAERPRFLSHIRLLSAERELGRLDAAAYHGRIAWQALNRLGRAERYLLSDVARETALLLAVAGEPEAAAVVFGWQRALIETTGVIEDESEEEMATRTRALVRGALAPERADVAIERGATGDDESVAQIARAALMRLERG